VVTKGKARENINKKQRDVSIFLRRRSWTVAFSEANQSRIELQNRNPGLCLAILVVRGWV
jgi:hypothetical protein